MTRQFNIVVQAELSGTEGRLCAAQQVGGVKSEWIFSLR